MGLGLYAGISGERNKSKVDFKKSLSFNHSFSRIYATKEIDPTTIHMAKKLTIAFMYLVVFIFIGCGEDDGISESTLGRLSGKRIVP